MIKIKKTFPTFWELMKYCDENSDILSVYCKDRRNGIDTMSPNVFKNGYNTIEIELDTNGYEPDKWHEWKGGENPLPSEIMCFIKTEGMFNFHARNSSSFDWVKDGDPDDIDYFYIPSNQEQTEYPEPPKKHETEFVGEPEKTDMEKCWDIIKCDYVKYRDQKPQKSNFQIIDGDNNIMDLNDNDNLSPVSFLEYWQPSTLEEYKQSFIGGE